MLLLYSEVSNHNLDTTDSSELKRMAAGANRKLTKSCAETYDTYAMLLMLIPEITRLAEVRIDNARNKYFPTEEERNPNMRFVGNLVAKQIADNEELCSYAHTAHLTWADKEETVQILLDSIIEQDFYKEYMSAPNCSYDDDKNLWLKAIKKVFIASPELFGTIEELSLYGASDFDQAMDFVLKTLKRMKAAEGAKAKLQPMFNDDNDQKIGNKILANAIEHYHDYNKLIEDQLHNWSLDRIVLTDRIVLVTALAEIIAIPTIPLEVSINEYINLAREYGSDDSNKFINGILDSICKKLREEKKILKY